MNIQPSETHMSLSRAALVLMFALVALPAAGAQKTVLYEHFTASW